MNGENYTVLLSLMVKHIKSRRRVWYIVLTEVVNIFSQMRK